MGGQEVAANASVWMAMKKHLTLSAFAISIIMQQGKIRSDEILDLRSGEGAQDIARPLRVK
jgi:hypothetical protein